ncbi:beta-ketoacyl-ACP synthase III [Nitrosomonas oligotropha]|uniref:Beta-ketoacyl-[acyl-carrier-protein] synthase III n=1 Tax=Nitrosomonas oligotropha TaxID=42354 RepID=A0A1H8M0A8_9PROT|nr:beta-ketoacyl-ACP synthase III [Nitrosomonas oligotropha]PTQ77276.1 3-oxoacyl-[acyl-carrier-protein] synthase III [Nitrosomonas oligotropha]SDW37207.1 3-oxoacyl-[acyl-carrier-protein] synthase III [Nitrosomonas oligotropha]SEO10797.1 3-oxoacyl-[acyl-carrier-protein] synthase III [Nitrosomonas oligotropha]
MYSRITGTGSYLPEKILTNLDLERMVDTSDEWIRTRTGITQRHIAGENQVASDLALYACQNAMQAAGVTSQDIDLIIVATTTPDMIFPSTACILQNKLGIENCPAFDVQAVCSGFVYALATADMFVSSGKCRNALVVGSEIYSKILDWNDRSTCVLFGDGAGAVVLSQSDQPGILSTHLHASGSHSNILSAPGSISGGKVQGTPYINMEGNAVFKFAVKVLEEVVQEAMAKNDLQSTDIDWLIPHQANIRIIQSTARKLGLPMDKVVVAVDKHGNTSAASIPLALDMAVRDGRIQRDQLVLLEGVGGGFTWGAVLLRW